MNHYISPISDFMNDGKVVPWLTSRIQLVVNDSAHVSDFVLKIKEQLGTLRQDLMMVIETEYVDAVYRDSYYAYFATKLKSYRRFCVRLSFFENVFSSAEEYVMLDETKLKESYLGFMIIRPLGRCIGRNCISPKAKAIPSDHIKVCLAEIDATCLGVKLRVKAFPHSSQDGEYMTCAETTTWSLGEYFGNKYVLYKPLLPSVLIESLQSHAIERMVPSQGLSIQQISMALSQQDFGCKMYSNTNPRFKELFTCYVESGLPLAVAVEGNGIGHAIVCIGRKDIDKSHILRKKVLFGTDYFMWNDSVDDFVFNDDNRPSYQLCPFDNPAPYFSGVSISHFIVPLHKKIYLAADQAIDIANFFVARDFKSPSDSVIRTFLTSSRTYREYIFRNPDIPTALKLAYLRIDLPKFIWVTEVATRSDFIINKVNSFILLDATSTLTAGDPYASLIFKQNRNQITIYDKKSRNLQNLLVSLPSKFESFNGNLV